MNNEKIEVVLDDVKTPDDLREMLDDIIANDCSGFGETGILYPIGMQEVYGADAPRHVEFQSPLGTAAMSYPDFRKLLWDWARSSKAYSSALEDRLNRACAAVDTWSA